MTTSEIDVLNEVLDLVDKWQIDGRTGFCLPVIRGELLEKLEKLSDDRRMNSC